MNTTASNQRVPSVRHMRIGTWYGAMLLATAVGFVLRWYQIHESLWLDELHTSWTVAANWHEIAHRAHAGNQSPLYFYLVWAIVQLFGQHEWALRLVSLLAGTALIPATAFVTRRWSGRALGAAALAAWLVALDRDCIFYAQEARPYALVQLIALSHGLLFVDVLRRPTRVRRLLFVFGAATLFYLHYTTFLYLLAELFCWLALHIGHRRGVAYRAGSLALDAAVIGLLLSPAIPHLLWVASQRANWNRLVGLWPSPALQLELEIYVALPLFALLIARLMRAAQPPSARMTVARIWTTCWWVVPLALAWLSTASGIAALWMLRYLVAALVGMIVFAALHIAALRNRRLRYLLGGVTIFASIASGGMVQQWRMDRRCIGDRVENWAGAVAYLNRMNHSQSRPVLLMSGLLEDPQLAPTSPSTFREYCKFPVTGIYRIKNTDVIPLPSRGPIRWTAAERRELSAQRACWLVVRASRLNAERHAQALIRALPHHAGSFAIVDARTFGRLTVLLLRRDPTYRVHR